MSDPRDLVSLSDAKTSLRLGSATTYDADLAGYITSASIAVEYLCGPVISAERSITFDGGTAAVLLPSAATDVTSVTENGDTITDYTANLASGIVFAGDQLAPRNFFPGRQNIVVTYSAGDAADPSEVAPNIALAARIIIRHLFMTNRGGSTAVPGMGDDETTVVEGLGFAIPNRALELLNPNPPMPGFA